MHVSRSALELLLALALTTIAIWTNAHGFMPLPRSLTTPVPASLAIPRLEPPSPLEVPSRPDAPVSEVLDPTYDRDDAIPRNAVAVADYELKARLDPNTHTVEGSGTITWRNLSSTSINALYVHLYLNAFKDDHSEFLSRRAAGPRGTGRIETFGHIEVSRFVVREMGADNLWPSAQRAFAQNPHDETDMRVPLPSTVEPQQTIHVDITWTTKLPSLVERSGYMGSFHMVAQWFPKIARLEPDGTFNHFPYRHLAEFAADFGTYDVRIDVPAAFTVAASGARLSETMHDMRRHVHHHQASIHDFAFAAFDGFTTTEVKWRDTIIRCFAPKGYSRLAQEQLEASQHTLAQLEAQYGPYPYPILSVVIPPIAAWEAGGMEYPTLITTGGAWYLPQFVGWSRGLVVHELGHQYFYGLVASDETQWPFLDEGITSYAETLAGDAIWGKSSLFDFADVQADYRTYARDRALRGGNLEVIAQPAHSFLNGLTYGQTVYARTALVLDTFDRAFSPDAMHKVLGRFARRYRYEHPGPAHLLGATRDVLGRDASDALATALFQRGSVDNEVVGLECSLTQHGHECHASVARKGSLALPVDVAFIAEDDARTVLIWDGSTSTSVLHHTTPRPIVQVVLDPELKVSLDEDLSNNAIDLRGKRHSYRVLERVAYMTQLALTGLLP